MGYYQEYDYSYSQTMNQNSGYQNPGYHLIDTFSGSYQTNTFNYNNPNPASNPYNVIYEEGDEVNQLRRSFDCYNLV